MKDDGGCWNSQSYIAKLSIIHGIWAGSQTRSLSDGLINAAPSYFFGRDWMQVPAETTVGDVEKQFDQLYQTPANRGITWHWAYILAAMVLRDDDSTDRTPLIKFLRAHPDGLPMGGTLVGVTAPDQLVIRSNHNNYSVHIEGISASKLNEEQRNRAMAAVRTLLSRVTFGDCSRGPTPSVSLSYNFQFFHQGILSADMTITGERFCLGGSSVSYPDLKWSGYNMSLSGFLLSRGLVGADPIVDPKWSDSRTKDFRLYFNNEAARNNGLYLFGPKTDPAIDKIIEYGLSHR